MLDVFWRWYERTYVLNVSVALGLFLLQLVHLIWLFGEVVWAKAFGVPLYTLTGIWQTIIILVDYTEIPALISVSLVYVHELRNRWNAKAAMYFLFLNLQWLHLFWISDEFVLDTLSGSGAHATILPLWLAWVAILIDYLELPVMYDLIRRFIKAAGQGKAGEFLRYELREQ